MNWKTATVVLLVVGGLSGCVDRKAQEQAKVTQAILEDQVVSVKTATATSGDLVDALEITGALTNSNDSQVTAQTGGRLVAVYVKDGDSVFAGQVLAKQDSSDANRRYLQAQSQVSAARATLRQAQIDASVGPQRSLASVRAARAQLAQAEAALLKAKNGARQEDKAQADATLKAARVAVEVAKADKDRAESLLKEGAISQQEYDQRRLGYENALAAYDRALQQQRVTQSATRPEDIQAANAAVSAAKENLQQALAAQRLDEQYSQRVLSAQANLASAEESVSIAQKAVEDAEIRAPFSGKVAGNPVQPGQFLAPGTPLLRLLGADGVYFDGEVPETSITKLQPGMSVTVSVDAIAEQNIAGRIAAINPAAESLGRIYKVRVTLDTVPPTLKVGMFARGKVELNRTAGVTMIPQVAVVKDTEGQFVFVAQDGTAKRRMIKLLGTAGSNYGVSGVAPGEKVIVEGQSLTKDGSKYREASGK